MAQSSQVISSIPAAPGHTCPHHKPKEEDVRMVLNSQGKFPAPSSSMNFITHPFEPATLWGRDLLTRLSQPWPIPGLRVGSVPLEPHSRE